MKEHVLAVHMYWVVFSASSCPCRPNFEDQRAQPALHFKCIGFT